jgi:serine/threonine protein phosphatase PrpC
MVHIVGRTHPGTRSGPNQDSMGWQDAAELAVVADGMGGYASGEIASDLVKRTVLEAAAARDLTGAIMHAHAKILAAAEEHPEYAGMGSTVVALQIGNRLGKVAWVGDSRAYLWRRGSLHPLTRDHSVGEVLRDAENLSETQLRNHPLRHKVIQSLGKDQPVPSIGETPLRRGDWILLCSDGLSGELRDNEIAEVLGAHPSLGGAADALIQGALVKGGSDNITVVLVEYTGPNSVDFGFLRNPRVVLWLSILSGVALAVTVAGIGWWLSRRN